MLKSKIFHFLAKGGNGPGDLDEFFKARSSHDKEITDFIEQISMSENTFISIDSVAYGRYEETNRIRTIITYRENPTRKVLTEKTND